MRLSLWSDGLVHKSLDAHQMAYLTVAYDWILFQHRFYERFCNGEEIFYFCFDFLKYICGDEFSLLRQSSSLGESESNGSHKSEMNLNGKIFDTEFEDGPVKLVAHEQTGSFEHLCDMKDANGSSQIGNETMNNQKLFPSSVDESYPRAHSADDTCNGSNGIESAILPIEQTLNNVSLSEHISKTVLTRKAKLMEVRKLVIDAYKEAAILANEQQQTNPGFAASFLSHISRTFNLSK